MDDLKRPPAETEQPDPPRPVFKVKPRSMGLRPGLSYDNIEKLLDYAEGPNHR